MSTIHPDEHNWNYVRTRGSTPQPDGDIFFRLTAMASERDGAENHLLKEINGENALSKIRLSFRDREKALKIYTICQPDPAKEAQNLVTLSSICSDHAALLLCLTQV